VLSDTGVVALFIKNSLLWGFGQGKLTLPLTVKPNRGVAPQRDENPSNALAIQASRVKVLSTALIELLLYPRWGQRHHRAVSTIVEYSFADLSSVQLHMRDSFRMR
jgi:hypothetical protein